jgi:hypothetical protein
VTDASFGLETDHEDCRGVLRQFVRRNVAEHVVSLDEADIVPSEVWPAAGHQKLVASRRRPSRTSVLWSGSCCGAPMAVAPPPDRGYSHLVSDR